MPIYLRSSTMPVPHTALSDWHFRAGALDRLNPPWMRIEVLQHPAVLADGAVARLRARVAGIPFLIESRIRDAVPGEGFTDEQERGPFLRWIHRHTFLPHDTSQSVLEDRVDYQLPAGPLVGGVLGGWAKRNLERAFAWRHQRTRHDLHHHAPFVGERLRVAVSGTSGAVGGSLIPFLTTGGHDVRRIVRRDAVHAHGDILWNQSSQNFDPRALEGLDAVVHLAGAGIADKPWSVERKRVIRDSRVEGTAALCKALAALKSPPRVVVCASATGFYGARDQDETLTEESMAGDGFLPDICKAVEAATQPAEQAGIRVVHLRIGIVLTLRGGMLARLRTPFSLGLGGPVGSGRQVLSWIHLDDLLGAIRFVLSSDVRGPVNAVGPHPVSNRDFGRALGRALSRPAIAPLPAFAVKALFGEMGETLILQGARVLPAALQRAGFVWQLPDLEQALRFELGRTT